MSRYVSVGLQAQVRARFANCCSYCQTDERLTAMRCEFEHIVPRSLGGATTFENLCLACSCCNRLKGDRVEFVDPVSEERIPMFHPQQEVWVDHFGWERESSLVVGKTAIRRATVAAFQMNREALVSMREMWVIFGKHPPAGSLS